MPRPTRRRALAAVLSALAAAAVLVAPSVSADDTVLQGTIYGADRRAVSALIGFDLRDAQGRVLGASGCVRSPSCPVDDYAVTRRVNFDLGPTGDPRDERWTTRWSVALPEQAERVYVEVFPQGRRYTGTDHSRYGASFRRNLPVDTRSTVHLRLPLVCGPEGGGDGSTGWIAGIAKDDEGRPVRLSRVTAYSMEAESHGPNPVLGVGVGAGNGNGYFRVDHLASGVAPGQRAGQRYQLIATAANGAVRRVYGVAVHDCRGVRADVRF